MAFIGGLLGNYNQKPSNLAGATVVDGFQIVMTIFFLLSGMFLFRPFARRIIDPASPRVKLGSYFLRRALRLLPLYYLVAVVCLLFLNYSSINGAWYVIRPMVLWQNYNGTWMAGMDLTWSVPTEVQWYLALPLIALAAGWYAKRGADPMNRARRLMIAVVPPLLVVGMVWEIYCHLPSMGAFPAQYLWPVGMAGNFACGFALGIMSAAHELVPGYTPALFRWARKRPNLFWLGALIMFAAYCANPFGRPGYGDWPNDKGAVIEYLLFTAFCLLVATPMIAPKAKSRLINAVLGNPVSVFLGRISYGIYLLQFLVMNLVLRNGSIFGHAPLTAPGLRGTVGFWQLEGETLGGTIILAVITYYLLERPILRWGERRINAKRQPNEASLAQ
jgi:peptidoglycan/LPS O-acetylase OafA/YrhL